MKVFTITFGCKVNQYESEAMLELFLQNGFVQSDTIDDADIIIINSCTVTANSDRKLRQTFNRIRNESPNSIVVLTGCMPQAFPNVAKNLIDADIVLGNSNRKNIICDVLKFMNTGRRIIDIKDYNDDSEYEVLTTRNLSGRTRALLKIEDGCNRFCSYCVIPHARGRVRSKPIDTMYSEALDLANKGYKEIVLVGINLSSFGVDTGLNLCDAVERVCSIPEIKRVRLGSLEPERMDEHVINRLSKQDKFCPQFHLSLQSGCDKILKAMNRHYTTAEYKEIVENLRKSFKDASITTDVLVGFPGETKDDFLDSLRFIEEIGFTKVHVFPYSRRSKTKADKLPNQIHCKEKALRSKEMIKLSMDVGNQFMNTQLNKEMEVLFETKDSDGLFEGYTKNYIPVKLNSDEDLNGKICTVKLTEVCDGFCNCQLISIE